MAAERLQPAHDPAFLAVGTQLNKHPVAGQDPDVVHLHLSRKMREDFGLQAVDLDPKHQTWQGFVHLALLRGFSFHYVTSS